VKAKSTLGILLTATLLAAFASTQKPASAESEQPSSPGQGASTSSGRSLPAGFQSYSAPNSSGHLIFAKLPPGAQSARAAMRDSLAALKTYFDSPLQLQGAVSDPHDQVVQVIVGASLLGQSMRGVATAVIGPSGTTFGLVFDRPDSLKSSFQNLSQRFAQEMPDSSGGSGTFDLSPPKQWQRQTAGDRSAAVDLPTGWRITGCKEGVITVVGPNNELIQLGMIFFVSTTPTSYGMAGPYLQPVPAFSYFVNYFTRVNLQQGINLNSVPGSVLEAKEVPAPMPNGKGAFLLQDVATNGHPGKVFALVYTARNLMTGWTLYTSYVGAPADVFPSEFADMMRIWSSWKVDDRVYQRQIEQTLQTMSETRDILRNGTERQMHAYDNLEESMGLIIRGETRVENNSLGGRADVYTQDTDAVLRACKNRGYQCQPVPFNELSQP
jgi:hypothetical protein